MEWCRAYQHDSLHGLVDKRAGGNCAKLAPLQIEDLAQRLHDYTPRDLFGAAACSMSGQSWTVDDLQVSVRRWYDVEYRSLTSYLQLLAVCEFSYQQTEKVYKSHSQRKVADFEEQLEKKLIDQAQTTPDTIFLAEDEAGLYLQATAAAVWSPVGQTPCVRVDPGRAQTHFYGTLNLVTGQELVLRSDVMNAQVSARYLEQILKTYPKHPIVLLWDRAPWHRGPAIWQVLAANPRLEIIYFPAGSPELNPQEHVWKATRGAVSHNHLEPRLPKLAEQFETHLTTTIFTSSFLDPVATPPFVRCLFDSSIRMLGPCQDWSRTALSTLGTRC